MTKAREPERERDGWRDLVRRYLAELDNPATDYTMRRIYRKWMADALDDPSKLLAEPAEEQP